MDEFKKMIAELQEAGLSQAEIGEAIDRSQAWVSAFLRGEYSDIKMNQAQALRTLHAERTAKAA